MPDYTPNHGYQLFTNDEEPWEHRTDFSALDTDVEIRDADSNRSDYEAEVGALFRATDTGAIYLGTESGWALADIQAGTVTATDQINNTVQAWDAEDFQTAIESADPVQIELNNEIDVSSVAPIQPGDNKRIVNRGGKRDNAIVNTSTNDTFELNNTSYLEFLGVFFDGDHSCPYHFGVADVDQQSTKEITFDRCYFKGFDTAAYYMSGQWRVKFTNTQIEGDQQGDYGIYCEKRDGDIGNNQLRITNESNIFECTSHGLYAASIGGLAVQASSFEHNRGAGIYIPETSSVEGCDITDCFFEANAHGIEAENGRLRISGGKFYAQHANGTLDPGNFGHHIFLKQHAKAAVSGIWCGANEGTPAIRTRSMTGPHTFIKCRAGSDGVNFSHPDGTAIDNDFATPGIDIRDGRVHYGEGEDVRDVSSPTKGLTAYHDPSVSGDSNTEGPAFYDGAAWVSQVDGSTIN